MSLPLNNTSSDLNEYVGPDWDWWWWPTGRCLLPLVFLPEIAGERDEQHGHEGSATDPDLQPQGDGLTRGRASGRQRYTFGAQLWLVPHVQGFLIRAQGDRWKVWLVLVLVLTNISLKSYFNHAVLICFVLYYESRLDDATNNAVKSSQTESKILLNPLSNLFGDSLNSIKMYFTNV